MSQDVRRGGVATEKNNSSNEVRDDWEKGLSGGIKKLIFGNEPIVSSARE